MDIVGAMRYAMYLPSRLYSRFSKKMRCDKKIKNIKDFNKCIYTYVVMCETRPYPTKSCPQPFIHFISVSTLKFQFISLKICYCVCLLDSMVNFKMPDYALF